MKTMYVVELFGQGDRYLFLVLGTIVDWINDVECPGRQGDESAWYDEATPAQFGEKARVTSGSYQNDRAMFLVGRQVDGVERFESMSEMFKWAKDNDVTVDEDSGFEGYIY